MSAVLRSSQKNFYEGRARERQPIVYIFFGLNQYFFGLSGRTASLKMPRDEKKKRKSEGKERRAASKKPKGKRLQITEIEIQQAKKKDLERFQKLYPKIFKRI